MVFEITHHLTPTFLRLMNLLNIQVDHTWILFTVKLCSFPSTFDPGTFLYWLYFSYTLFAFLRYISVWMVIFTAIKSHVWYTIIPSKIKLKYYFIKYIYQTYYWWKIIHKATRVFNETAFCHIEISSILDKLFLCDLN